MKRLSDGAVRRTEPLMGTFLQIKAFSPEGASVPSESTVDGAFSLARSVENRLSCYMPGSEVNQLNMKKVSTVSPGLYDVLALSKEMSRLTGGEFDVTIAPVMKAGGFYGDMPDELLKMIPDGFGGVGWRNVVLGIDNTTVILRKGAWLDLSGIAKGYIVDSVAGYLEDNGPDDILVNAGGDIYCGNKEQGAWTIGVRRPGARGMVYRLLLEDAAVATSGDYENVVVDGATDEVMSHIIDPALERPLVQRPSSVTVIAPSCAMADALATGMMAMGHDRAIELADSLEGVDIICVDAAGGAVRVRMSQGAGKYIDQRM